MNRREFLRIGGMSMMALVLGGCGLSSLTGGSHRAGRLAAVRRLALPRLPHRVRQRRQAARRLSSIIPPQDARSVWLRSLPGSAGQTS